jgi:hypothetical protein
MHLLLLAALLTSIPPVQVGTPNLQPQLASVPGLTAVVFGSANSIWLSISQDNGHTFSAATQVARLPVLALHRHRGPRAVISGRTIVVSAVFGKRSPVGASGHHLAAAADLMVWRSTDKGHSWSKPVAINDVPGSAREGLHAMAAGKHGEIAVVWLDLRSAGTRLYGSYSKDDGVTWSKNVLIYESPDGTICQCCDPSITSSGKNHFDVMFRNDLQGARDLYLTNWHLDGQLSEPRKLGTGSWNINACPMDGGGVAHHGSTTATAWRRDRTVYLDEPGKPEVAIGQGKDVALALSAKGPYVAWTSSSGIELHRPGENQPISLSSAGNFPVLTNLANGSVIAAWEQDGKIQIEIVD